MLACVDTFYSPQGGARTALVLFHDWLDSTPSEVVIREVADVQPYVSGQFFQRELPCILDALEAVKHNVHTVIIDGYVWLRNDSDPGLGAYLFEALHRSTPVIGVAKNEFKGGSAAKAVLRGQSKKPLFVTSVGIDAHSACENLSEMHGQYRIPTMISFADRHSRPSHPQSTSSSRHS